MEKELAACGVCFRSSDCEECCICFAKMCAAPSTHKNLCIGCVMKLNEYDDDGNLIHPVQRVPLKMCQCGKPWNQDCGLQYTSSIFGTTVKIYVGPLPTSDVTKNCLDLKNPDYWIRSNIIHAPKK